MLFCFFLEIPTPLSSTSICSLTLDSVWSSFETRITTSPFWVNFTEFPIKLIKTCENFSGSPINLFGISSSYSSFRMFLRSSADFLSATRTSFIRFLREKEVFSISTLLASSLLRSRMLLISDKRYSPENFNEFKCSFCCSRGSSSSKRCVSPVTAYSGVRSS